MVINAENYGEIEVGIPFQIGQENLNYILYICGFVDLFARNAYKWSNHIRSLIKSEIWEQDEVIRLGYSIVFVLKYIFVDK